MNSLKVLLLLISLIISQSVFSQNYGTISKPPQTNCNYKNLGGALPDSIPIIFASDIISTKDYNEHTLTISPDGKEIFFTRDPLNVWSLKVINGKWSLPEKTELNLCSLKSEVFW